TEYIRNIPAERVVQFHLAGHTNCGTHLIDTHDGAVIDPVWELYRLAHRRTGGAATLLEWDAKIPPFPVVHAEVLKARNYMSAALDPKKGSVPLEQARARSAVRPGAVADSAAVSNPLSFIVPEVQGSDSYVAGVY
ncbi:MAG TPA: DUF692 family protein, partial [Gemmataceae bacterium]|nr:DUF692 family protein [Gemmataceae bacterium]